MRSIYSPKSEKQSTGTITRLWDKVRGMFIDPPANKIPQGGVRRLVNGKAFGGYWAGRKGSRVYDPSGADTRLPTIWTGYTASQAGKVITVEAGEIPEEDPLGKYFVWADGKSDEITSVAWPNLTVKNTSTRATTAGCAFREKVYCDIFHRGPTEKGDPDRKQDFCF